jgi:hypothetical protein
MLINCLEKRIYPTYNFFSKFQMERFNLDNCLLAGACWRITMRPKTYLFSRKILMKQQKCCGE